MKKTIILLSFLIFTNTINSQSIKIDSLKLNNKFSVLIGFDKLKNTKEIDSITPIPELMDISNADSLVYIGNTYFEYFKKSNTCILGSIVLDEKIKTITLNSFTLDKNTTFEDLKKMFPTDCSVAQPMNIYSDETDYITCSIGTINDDGEKTDNRLLFFFSNNKLKRIDLWEPS